MIFWWLVQVVVMFALSYLLAPKPKIPKVNPLSLADFDIPTAEEGRCIQWVFGKKLCKGPNVIWYGDLLVIPRKEKVKTSIFNSKRKTVGYYYYLGMHMVFGYSHMDGLKQIYAGEKCIWPTVNDPSVEAADGQTRIYIDATNIFGGKEKEGGIRGWVDIEYGGLTQGQNSYLTGHQGSNTPAYRGFSALILNQVYLGTNAYIKPWSALWKRTDTLINGSPQWYVSKANVGDDDMNPAHMIREGLTDQEAGLGFNTSSVNDASFTDAADALFTEGFGLSANWDASVPMEDWIGNILNHIDGALYQDLTTGEWKLKLARDDYNPATLDIYDDGDIIDIEEFSRPSFSDIPSQVQVTWTDRLTEKPRTAYAHDLAVMQKQSGNIVDMTLDFRMIHDGALATKVANRELKQAGSMLATMRLRVLRTMAGITPYSVFKISWPRRNITEMIVRVQAIDYGDMNDSTMLIDVMEDVFGTAYNVYSTPPASQHTDYQTLPVDTTYRLILEAPYYVLCTELYSQSIVDAWASDVAYMIAGAVAPSVDSFDYELYIQNVSEGYTLEGSGPFTPSALLVSDLDIGGPDITVDYSSATYIINVDVDDLCQIDNEIFRVVSIDTTNSQVTLARGQLDTVPANHSANARIWFWGSSAYLVEREYSNGDTPDAKFLPRTSLGILDLASATAESATAFSDRLYRPYLPGYLRINSAWFPEYITGQPSFAWKHRDRTQQLNGLIDWDYGFSIGPETNVTYTIKVYDEDNSLVRTETGITTESYVYTEAFERADCGLGPSDALNGRLRFEIFSVRSGVESWQKYDFWVKRKISGTSTATATVTGSLSVETTLIGTASSQATITGDISISGYKLEGVSIASSSTSGSLSVETTLSGASPAVATIIGDITII
jgi:hypothetical protein